MMHCRWPRCDAEMYYSETAFCWVHLFWMVTVFVNVTIWSAAAALWVFG